MNPSSPAPVFVEVLSRNGDVLARHRLDVLPIRIGRAYDNDLILDDPYVAAHHVVIEASGTGQADEAVGLVARDVGSRNGLYRAGARLRGGLSGRQPEIALQPDTVCRIGHTLLRVRRADDQVPTELIDTTSHDWEGAPPAMAAAVGVVGIGLLSTWLSDTEGQELLEYVMTLVSLVGAVLMWATFWAILNRIFGARMRFGRHLFIGASGLIASVLWEEFAELAAFSFSLESLSRFDSLAAPLILALVVRHHIVTIRPHALRFARTAAASIAIVMIAFILVQSQVSRRRLADELYLSAFKPPVLRLTGEVGAERFFEAAKSAKSAVDRARREQPAALEE